MRAMLLSPGKAFPRRVTNCNRAREEAHMWGIDSQRLVNLSAVSLGADHVYGLQASLAPQGLVLGDGITENQPGTRKDKKIGCAPKLSVGGWPPGDKGGNVLGDAKARGRVSRGEAAP